MTRTERIYYLVFGLYCSSWGSMMSVYPLFLLSRGLDLFEINVVFAVYLITTFLFEVPTGAVADVAGRKISFLLSCAVRAVAFGLYWCADGFLDCVVAEFIDAIGTTLATGALDAWVIDGMREEGGKRAAERVFARAYQVASPMMIISGVAGAYLADRDIALPWLCGTFLFASTAIVGALLMRESRAHAERPGFTLKEWLQTTGNSLALVRRVPVLLTMCLLTGATAFAVMPAWHYWPARLQDLSGQGIWLLGWIWALIALAGMAGNTALPWLVPRFRRGRLLAVVSLWRAVMLLMAAATSRFGLNVAAVLTMQTVHGVAEPTLQGWMNEHADSNVRATVLSVRSMAFTLGSGIGLLCLGLLGRGTDIATVWGVAGLLLVAVAPCFLLLDRPAPLAEPSPVRRLA